MNDDECVGGAQMDAALSGPRRDARWGTPAAERRVALVVLHRVDPGALGPSPAEQANRLGPSMPFEDDRHCPRCTLFYAPGQVWCKTCFMVLPHGR